MTIEFTTGDILQAETDALVNSVNCVGVMGRGVALQFKKAFPENFKAYKRVCDREDLQPGKMFVYDLGRLIKPRYVINFPTKRHWRGKSRLADIEAGLRALIEVVREKHIQSIAVPPLGCGLGGLDWCVVRRAQHEHQEAFEGMPDVHVVLYEPKGAPAPAKMVRQKATPSMTPGRAALLGLMRRYLDTLMDPFVTLLEIHKLMYFMQEGGEPLALRYRKALYGPYADNLRHVLTEIEGYFISGYGDAEDRPDKQIELIPEAARQAEAFLQGHPDTLERFERVAGLVEGFATPFGMELLATVHWVATREGARSPEEAAAMTYGWNERKRIFRKSHIEKAWDILAGAGWLSSVAAGHNDDRN